MRMSMKTAIALGAAVRTGVRPDGRMLAPVMPTTTATAS